jgi:uncharacterized membrane protein YfcA
MYDLTLVEWVLAVFAAIGIGMAKAGFGGLGMLAILIMARVLPARESTGAILPMLILADVFAVYTYRQHARGGLVLRMLPPALTGIVCGWFLMPYIPAKDFGPLIGWLTLALIVLLLVQKFAPRLMNLAVEHPGIAWPFGWLAGTTTMIANAAGPVMTIYLLACRLPKFEFVGTAAWFFFAINLLKVPFSASLGLINSASLMLNLWLAPGVIAGVFAGRWLLGKNQPSRLRVADDYLFAPRGAAPDPLVAS